MMGTTVFLFLKTAERSSNFGVALLMVLISLPLISDRKEIRPEGFSYLFMGIYYYLLTLFQHKELNFKKLLLILIPLQLLWVNMHIFFIMGIFITGMFAFQELYSYVLLKKEGMLKKNSEFKKKSHAQKYMIVLITLIFVSLLNPYGFWGLLEPFNILKEYGYMIIENQPVIFMQQRAPKPLYFHLELFTLVVFTAFIQIVAAKKLKLYLMPLGFVLAYLILAFKAIRGIPMFGLFLIPFLAKYLNDFYTFEKNKLLIPITVIIVLTLIPGHYISAINKQFGYTLAKRANSSAEFFKQNNIKGPIYNNYDIGGYLIYHLYDNRNSYNTRVFVDNRPEAYSVGFLQNTYLKIQSSNELWKQAESEYKFNVIFFYRHDATTWAQPFLIERLKDETWIPVYVDDYAIIFLKDIEQNMEIINKYRLPNNMFTATKL
ncbi:MAG: hypothetical protein JW922_10190 [Paludibacteraceae bacterium]|nr:hypothetical protein [Paludibacteraceae bacterium]